jgi:hypothetical protein
MPKIGWKERVKDGKSAQGARECAKGCSVLLKDHACVFGRQTLAATAELFAQGRADGIGNVSFPPNQFCPVAEGFATDE